MAAAKDMKYALATGGVDKMADVGVKQAAKIGGMLEFEISLRPVVACNSRIDDYLPGKRTLANVFPRLAFAWHRSSLQVKTASHIVRLKDSGRDSGQIIVYHLVDKWCCQLNLSPPCSEINKS